MRTLKIVVAICVIGVVAGSVYVHRDTRQFVEDLRKPISNNTVSIEDPHQHGKDLNSQPNSQ